MAELLKGLSIDLDLNTIKLDRGLKGVKDSVKTVNSEMKANMSAFDRSDRSVGKYETRLDGLNKKLDVQKEVVKEAKSEYEKMVSEYGEGSKQAENASREYNNQAAALNNLERYIERTKDELIELKKEQAIADSGWTKAGDSLINFGNKLGGVGSTVKDIGGSLTKWITVPAMGVVSAVGGITAAFGWGRLVGLDSAQAQLRGLGYEAEDVERISDGLVEALDGGMMTMAEATSAAATAMAAGVEEGDELARYIQILDAAVVGGTGSFQEMEQIFGRIVDQGYMTRGEFDMMAQRMPGFSSAVQEAMGVSSEEMYEMLRDGEITTSQFLDIMEGFAGDMATEYSKSWSGMVQNTKAYIGIIGESLLGGVFEKSKESISQFLELLQSDVVMDWAAETGEKIGDTFSKIVDSVKSGIEWFIQLESWQQKLIGSVGGFAVALGPLLTVFGTLIIFAGRVATGLGSLFEFIGKNKALKAFGDTAEKSAKKGGLFRKLLGYLLTGLRFLAGPIGWVITGVLALGTAFTTAYKKSETFREGVNKIIDSVKNVFAKVKEFIEGIKGLFQDDGQAGRDILASLGFSDKFIETVDFIALKLSHIRGLVTNFVDGIKGLFKDDGQEGRDLLSSIGVSDKMIAVLDGIALKIVLFRDNVQKAFGAAVDFVKNAWSSVTSWFSSTGGSMVEKATGIFGSIKTAVSTGIQTAVDFVKNLWGGLINWWNQNGDSILAKAVSIFNAVRDNVSLAISTVVSYVKSIWSSLTDFWNQHGEMISQAASNVWNFIKTVVLGTANIIWAGIKGFATGIYTAIKWALDNIAAGWSVVWPHIRDIATGVINAISSAVQFVFPYIVTIIQGAMSVISKIMTYVWPAVKFIVIETWNAIKGTIDGALKVITGIIQFFSALFTGNWSALWDSVKQILGGAVQFIWNFVQVSFFGRIIKGGVLFIKGFAGLFTTMWGGIRTLFSNVITWIVGFVRNMFTGMSNTIGSITQTIRNVISTIWNGIWSFFSKIISTIVTFIRNRFTAMRETINSITTKIRELISLLWNNIYTFFQTVIRNIVDFVRTRFTTMRDNVSNIFTTIRDTAQRLWNAVKDKIWNPVKNVVKNVKDRFTTLKDNVSGIFSNMRDNVADWIGRMIKAVTDMPGKMANGLRTTASKIGDALASVGNTMLGTLGKGVNGVIAGINWVLDKLGISSKISEWKVPTVGAASSGSKMSMKGVPAGIAEYAHGTDGHPKKGPAWIGDGVGRNAGRELVRLPNGKEFLSPATPTLMPDMPKGTHVLSALDTKEYLKAPRYMFGTIGNGFKSAWEGTKSAASWTWDKTKQGANAVKDTALDVWEYVEDPAKLLNKALDALGIFPEKMIGALKELPTAGFNKVKDGGIKYLKKKIDDLFGGPDGISGGMGMTGAVGNWGMQIRRAAAQMGEKVSAKEVQGILAQIQRESGGNQRIVQSSAVWDVNTAAGNPARGLLQYIPQTFNAYKVKGHGNIYSGYDQLLAFFNNKTWRRDLPYGKRGWGPRGGRKFATGGKILKNGLYQLAEGGFPEWVIPTDPSRRTEAMKLLALAGKEISGNKRPHQLPNVSGNNDRQYDNDRAEEISLLRQQVELLTQLVLSSQNIEAKPVLTEGDIKRSYDKRDSRESAKHGIFTGRPGGAY